MNALRRTLGRVDDFIAKVEDILAAYLHGAIAVMVIVAVALRYLFNNPLTWGEELIVAMLTWMVFLGAAAAVRSQMHIRIDVMAPVFRQPKFTWLNVVTVLIGLAVIVVAIASCYEFVLQELVVDSPMMGISKAWIVSAMPVGLTFMLLHVIRIWLDQGAAPVFRGETEVLVMNEEGIE